MRLGLSSAAAPAATLEELVAACAARGLVSLELRAGDGHGIAARDDDRVLVAQALTRAATAGVTITGYSTDGAGDTGQLARLSQALGAPILVSCECDVEERIERARAIMDGAGRALVLASGGASTWHAAVAAAGLDFAWEVDAACGDVSADADLMLRQEPALRYIRLVGGGPESTMQEGRGIGTLMGRLALAGYDGPLVLAPSSTRYRVAWETWLGRRGGWGCGGRSSAAELVHLPVRTATGST